MSARVPFLRVAPSAIMAALAGACLGGLQAGANPVGATVSQGTAKFISQGPQLTIQTSANTFINWQSFNIGLGETTTFVQPSSSSVVWNHINDANPSQILGNLNANGLVVLQNQAGFYIGGQASITAHGLIMTTSPIPMPDLTAGGPWDFSAPPPTARIINYGQLSLDKGGSVFLIANTIENHGTISAPEGNIGLYAGKDVLLSERPDGRGLSAQVTLPSGSVDNSGNLIADAGTIAVHAQVVNQGGLVQANSIREVNGAIELVAGDSLNLGSSSVISATGDSQGASAGGSVTLQSGGSYQDAPGSTINVSGGAQGGNGGQIEISAPEIASIQSGIMARAAAGFMAGKLFIDPANIVLVSGSGDSAPASGTVNVNDPPSAGSPDTLTLDVDTFNTLISQNLLSQIDLQASQDIEVAAFWNVPDSLTKNSSLSLEAGRNITLDNGAGIHAGMNWTLNLTAGTAFVPTAQQPTPAAGTYGIYLNGTADLQTQDGDINLNAANEVQIATGDTSTTEFNGIRTLAGGNITVNTQYGDVNTGSNPTGYDYSAVAPYYGVDPGVGGISTAAGGNVTIHAAGNVISLAPSTGPPYFLANSDVASDGGTGAFGPEPGNVTITAGGSITGHYVLANGTGMLQAAGDAGTLNGDPFSLSLIKGTWNVNAGGNIYLQEVRNPNGVFNNLINGRISNSHGRFLFDYDPDAAVNLTAADAVYLTGASLPRPLNTGPNPAQLPGVLYPPILDITAGSGGVILESSVTLFPSADGDLSITTTGNGNLISMSSSPGVIPELMMSDSAQTQWQTAKTFTDADHGATPLPGTLLVDPLGINGLNPLMIFNISGSMENLTLITTKATDLTIGGDMINCGFSGQNLHSTDHTTFNVTGQIFNSSVFAFVTVSSAIPAFAANDLPPGTVNVWSDVFNLALNPAVLANITVAPGTLPGDLAGIAFQAAGVFTTTAGAIAANPGFLYNPATGRLGFAGPLSPQIVAELTQPLVVLRYGPDGNPIVDASGHFVTDTVNWVSAADLQTLATASQSSAQPGSSQLGYRLGGPGEFDINAGSISLGNSYGILSCGVEDPQGGLARYQNLAAITPDGATVDVTVQGNLEMLTSTIAAIGGGDVIATSISGSMDLGSEDLFNTSRQVGFGLFTSGPGDVTVTAAQDVNVDGSRIAAYDGGNIKITSLNGNVNAGSGGASITGVGVSYVTANGKPGFYAEDVFGSGILAYTLVDPSAVPGAARQPGNITITTPKGDIIASLGGILQEALNGNVAAGPTVTLTAGTAPSGNSPGFTGNVDLGDSGVIGGTVNVTANGNITGLVISRQNSTINAAQNFSGTVLSGGFVGLAAGGTATGTVIGVQGVSTSSGIQGGGLTALGQNVSVNGGAATSTLGTSATASSASQSAANTANADAQQQVASNTSNPDDDPLKKKGKSPLLSRRVSRVTVILPKG